MRRGSHHGARDLGPLARWNAILLQWDRGSASRRSHSFGQLRGADGTLASMTPWLNASERHALLIYSSAPHGLASIRPRHDTTEGWPRRERCRARWYCYNAAEDAD